MFSGLILYNGETDNNQVGDFISLSMSGSRVEFRFDLGSGPVIITSDPVALDTWHTVRIKRNKREGQLKCF